MVAAATGGGKSGKRPLVSPLAGLVQFTRKQSAQKREAEEDGGLFGSMQCTPKKQRQPAALTPLQTRPAGAGSVD